MASGSDRRILNLPLIASGNVVSTIVLPLDDPSDNLTKKINLGQIKDFVLSGTSDLNYYTTGATYSDGIIYFDRNDQLSAYTVNISSLTGDANTFITAVTYTSSANTITLTDNTNNSFNTYIDSVSGLTVNGSLSATTLYTNGNLVTQFTGGTVNGLTATTISSDSIVISGTNLNPKQTISLFFGHDALSPNDNQTYYIGNSINLTAPISGSDGRRVVMPKTGNIVSVVICQTVGGSLGSSETSTFTINNVTQSTQSTITTTFTYDSSSANISYVLNSPLGVNEGDKIEIRWLTPVWLTNPTTVRHQMNVYLEY